MGGRSAEREVSLSTGRQALAALDPEKYEAFGVDPAHLGARAEAGGLPPPSEDAFAGSLVPIQALLNPTTRPDVALICLHGRYGEDGAIQGLLELLGIPYTGSDVLGSALAMNKPRAKAVFQRHGIPTPRWTEVLGAAEAADYLRGGFESPGAPTLPAIVKPANQGSTIGMTVARTAEELAPALETALAYDREVLIEEFVSGTEITAAVLGSAPPDVLPLVEIIPASGFYDYQAKYTPGATKEIVPARLPDSTAATARELALRSHRALGCRALSRVDMIIADGGIQVLEVNTIPGMTPTSLLPRAAAAAGIAFPELLDRLLELALQPGSADLDGEPRIETDAASGAQECELQ